MSSMPASRILLVSQPVRPAERRTTGSAKCRGSGREIFKKEVEGGNLGELEVAQVYGAIGAAGVAANQMKTATFISLIFWFLVIFDQKTQKTDKSQHV